MNKILLLLSILFVSTVLFSAQATKKRVIKKPTTVKYINYYGITFGTTKQTRKVTINSNSSGANICIIGSSTCNQWIADGKSYSFEEDQNYGRANLLYGTQRGYTGNFYEIGAFASSDISEIFGNIGYTLPQYSFSVRWFVPFVKGGLGLGYSGADSLNPTSLSGTLGLGGYTILRNFKLRYGFDYTLREWSKVEHSFGEELWRDSETRGYLGLTYNY